MKKISLLLALAGSLLLIVSGCLKDDGLDANEYGTVVDEVKAVAFPQAPKSPVLGSINSQTAPSVVQGPFITLEQEGNASGDVSVTLIQDNKLVTDAKLTPLPAGTFTVNTLSVVIPSGKKSSDAVKITIPNSTLLDPTKSYGLGLVISTVSSGYIIAGNQKTVVIGFTIKNKYDGVYKLRLKTTGWASYGISEGITSDYPKEFDIITVGENSVSLLNTEYYDDLLPAMTGTALPLSPTGFGATTPLFVFDNATNKLTDVRNTTADDGRGRKLKLNTAITTSRYDPATKTIFAAFIMDQTGRPSQFFYDTLTYIKAR